MTENKPTKAAPEPTGQIVLANDQLPAIAQVDNQYAGMIMLALEKDVEIEKLERLFVLQEKFEKEQARKLYLQAMSRFQSDIPIVTKDGHADFGEGKASFDYAKLEDILAAVQPHLAPNGLSYEWQGSVANAIITMTCTMSHIDGGSKFSSMESTLITGPGMSGIHSTATTRSYLKRYTFLDVSGVICVGEDNDAQDVTDAPEGELPVYFDQRKLDSMMDAIKKKVLEENRDPQELIAWLESKGGKLAEHQKETILTIGK